MKLFHKAMQVTNRIRKSLEVILKDRFFSKINYINKYIRIMIKRRTGYAYFQFQDALAISTLILIISKIFLFLIFSFQITPLYNITLLLIFTLIGLKFQFINFIREKLYIILSSGLGEWYIGFDGETWYDIARREHHGLSFGISTINGLPYEVPKQRIFHKVFLYFCEFLIYIRLWIYAETWIYILLRYLVYYWLIFNQLLIITYFLSLIFILSRFLFLFTDRTYTNFIKGLESFYAYEPTLHLNTIQPTFFNARIILIWITDSLDKSLFNIKYKFSEYKYKHYLFKDNELFSFRHSSLANSIPRIENFYPNWLPLWHIDNKLEYQYKRKNIFKYDIKLVKLFKKIQKLFKKNAQ